MIISAQELPLSPFEQTSQGVGLYVWDPSAAGTNDLLAGETPTAPVAKVYQVDPSFTLNQADWSDVTSSVVVATYPKIGTGAQANMILVALKTLAAGYGYIVVLTFTATATSHLPSRFLRVSCKI